MSLRRWACAALLCAGGAAAGHTLDAATARVTLRDDHLEVALEADLFLLVEGGPTAAATASPEALQERLARAQQALLAQTRLEAGGGPLPLTVRGFPSVDEARALAALLSASGRDHGELVRLRLESPAAAPGARTVRLSLPPALGPVVISFVQPATRYTAPGGAAEFEVLQAPPQSQQPGRWSGGAAALACLAGAGALLLQRKRSAR